jgi:hypothetical protein
MHNLRPPLESADLLQGTVELTATAVISCKGLTKSAPARATQSVLPSPGLPSWHHAVRPIGDITSHAGAAGGITVGLCQAFALSAIHVCAQICTGNSPKQYSSDMCCEQRVEPRESRGQNLITSFIHQRHHTPAARPRRCVALACWLAAALSVAPRLPYHMSHHMSYHML